MADPIVVLFEMALLIHVFCNRPLAVIKGEQELGLLLPSSAMVQLLSLLRSQPRRLVRPLSKLLLQIPL